jgi:hypothetical protein
MNIVQRKIVFFVDFDFETRFLKIYTPKTPSENFCVIKEGYYLRICILN